MSAAMSIGLGTALAGLFGGGAAITSGILQSRASDRATDANKSAATSAEHVAEDQLAENRRQFDQTQENNWQQYLYKEKQLAPYRGLSLSANNTLASMLGIPIENVAPPPTPNFGKGPTDPSQSFRATQGGAPNIDGRQVQTATGPTLNTMLTRPATTTSPQPQGQMVTLRAPNGKTQQVPQALAQHYVSRGASIVQ